MVRRYRKKRTPKRRFSRRRFSRRYRRRGVKPDGLVKEKIVIVKDVTSPIDTEEGYFNIHWTSKNMGGTNNAAFNSDNQ